MGVVELAPAAAAAETSPRARVRATAFFATTDQRGAGGEGSCTLCCVALAEWLEANPGRSPTEAIPLDAMEEALSVSSDSDIDAANDADADADADAPGTIPAAKFVMDGIIAGAAREWRAFCRDDALVARFPDRHLDLDTAVRLHAPFSAAAEAIAATVERRGGEKAEKATTSAWASASASSSSHASFRIPASIRLRPGDSFVGFLAPPGASRGDSPTLDALADAAPPLRAIVDELAAMAPATFVVSWNDHFFVLRFARESRPNRKSRPDSDPRPRDDDEDELVAYAYDSLGERLCEGCKRGYALRFDAESLEGDEKGTAAAVAAYPSATAPPRLLRHLAEDAAARGGGPGRDGTGPGDAHATAADRVSSRRGRGGGKV